jgi:hypothetical protein
MVALLSEGRHRDHSDAVVRDRVVDGIGIGFVVCGGRPRHSSDSVGLRMLSGGNWILERRWG